MMNSSQLIHLKLEAFIKKYYTNELIRGILFFIGIGLLYFIFTLFIEYFLWLQPLSRSILFLVFILVEFFLLLRYILFPVFKIIKLQKGLDYTQASVIIGNHFSEVNDKLLNFLQLSNVENRSSNSELMLASIEQKANSLHPIPFGKAIDFKTNTKYLPLAVFPILLLFLFFISGNSTIISQSFNRVVHFKTAFIPPAPFKFVVLNSTLITQEGKDFTLKIKIIGKIVPENVSIFIDNESYFLESTQPGEFTFKFSKPVSNILFHIESNSIVSSDYELKVIAVPSISNFVMKFDYPSYLHKKSTIVKGTGNGIIPDGTIVSWLISTSATESVLFSNNNEYSPFTKTNKQFFISKKINIDTDYQIVTSNKHIKEYEKLSYQLTVVKDQLPSITVSQAPDSLGVDQSYYIGQLTDDYGISKLSIVYYETENPKSAKRGTIAIKHSTFEQFVFKFPSNLDIEKGKHYDFYFEVYDNDALHNFKSSRSSIFSNRLLSDEEKQNSVIQEQFNSLDGLQKTLSKQTNQFSNLDKLQKNSKEKNNFDFKDRQKINEFLQQQEKQNELMKNFASKIKNNFDKVDPKEKSESKELLQKRLENTEKDIEKNKKLLDELKDINEKIKDEDFSQKLEKFKQNSKNQNKSLEQLVELTKRYYVEKKAEQIASKLQNLAEKEEKLSDDEKLNSVVEQQKLTDEFKKIQSELNQLDKDNEDLKNPMDIPTDSDKEKSINDDLNKANSELQKSNKSKAKPNQKSASKKMKELSKSMTQALEESGKDQLEEDTKVLRQILDNLLAYSFSQEEVMNQFKQIKSGSPSFSKHIRTQYNLKSQFKHIDDSLFALSLRQPKIAESVTKEVANIQYNIDKSLESLSETQLQRGYTLQQYAISSANKLADELSNSLNSMQMQLSGSSGGKPKPGQGSGMQLPDIIKKQGELSDKMKQGNKPGESSGSGNKSKPGANGKTEGSNKGEGAGDNEGDSDGDSKAIMDIYKEQTKLREALQQELNRKGIGSTGKNTLEQMKQLEKQLLNKGFSNDVIQKSKQIKQDLLKLETALRLQGEDTKRQSETNTSMYTNPAPSIPKGVTDYLNTIEILNRQSLPLRSNFNQKVQVYFNQK